MVDLHRIYKLSHLLNEFETLKLQSLFPQLNIASLVSLNRFWISYRHVLIFSLKVLSF